MTTSLLTVASFRYAMLPKISVAREKLLTVGTGTQALPPPQRNTGYSTSSYGGAVDRGRSNRSAHFQTLILIVLL